MIYDLHKQEMKMQKKIAAGDLAKKASVLYYPILLFFLIFASIVIYGSGFFYITRLYIIHHSHTPSSPTHFIKKTRERLPFAIGDGDGDCDIFRGRWVRDYDRPLYNESDCPFIGEQLTCHSHGRPENDYQYWRWQPNGCDLPSFNATMMLEELRGKRLLFVGDSINRGQFTSLVCLLHRVIPQHAYSMETFDSLTVFTAKDYNARIEYYWMPMLVESNADDPEQHRVSNRIIVNAPIGKHGHFWKGADIILFNSYIWWVQGVNLLKKGSLEGEVKETVKVSMYDGYRIAMKMMIKWVNENIHHNKTRLFFVGLSATHQRSYTWGGDPKGNCYNETTMIEDRRFVGAQTSLYPIIEEEFRKSRVPITFLNITELTSGRKDAHTSIYRAYRQPLNRTHLANPIPYADCIHWCLPGLQDDWNQLLFANLFYP